MSFKLHIFDFEYPINGVTITFKPFISEKVHSVILASPHFNIKFSTALFLNILSEISVTVDGILIFFNSDIPEKASSSIFSNPSGKDKYFILLQPAKALFLITLTFLGRTSFFKPLQPTKASSPIVFTVSGNIIFST